MLKIEPKFFQDLFLCMDEIFILDLLFAMLGEVNKKGNIFV